MDKAQVGECGELIVAVDLMRRGYEIFKAMNHTCSCDLVALKDGQCWRVQVKVGIHYLPSSHEKFDVLAVVKDFASNPSIVYVGSNKELVKEL